MNALSLSKSTPRNSQGNKLWARLIASRTRLPSRLTSGRHSVHPVATSTIVRVWMNEPATAVPRLASPGMLLNKFPPMIGAAPPNRLGGAHGGNDQHGREARGFVGGGGALPIGAAVGEGAHSRRAVPDDRLAPQARGSGLAAARRR